MLATVRHRRLFPALLSALIVLGLWSNAMAALFCPHMIGGDCCLTQKAESGSHHHGDSGSSSNHHSMDHMHMSAMDMDVSVSDMEMNDTAVPLPTLDRDLSYKVRSETKTRVTTEAISEEPGPCSHCEMHSRSVVTFPVSVSGQANLSHEIIAPEAATTTLKNGPLVPAFFELHEHGPPGSLASSVYILISAFRI